MQFGNTIGLALISGVLIACAVILPMSGTGTETYDETVAWVALAAGFGLAVVTALSVLSETPVARFGWKRALLAWGALTTVMTFALFTDWAAYWTATDGILDVCFEWVGVTLIWALFLLLPQALRREWPEVVGSPSTPEGTGGPQP